MRKLTFIHTADLHLDSPMVGLRHLPENLFRQLRESTFTAFTKIIDVAIEKHVDFIIIAGDLFDGEDRSVRAQVRFRKEMERLNEHHIQAYVIHGNHDHLNGTWTMMNMPSNVHIFSEDVEMKVFQQNTGMSVHLYGFSYRERHIYDDMTMYYKRKGNADYHIGLLHGHAEGVSEHSRYAPFQLQQLLEKQFDYWALGHIHKHAILHQDPYVVYPGNIQGRYRSEAGEKGCYVVTITDGQTELEWVNTAPIIWEQMMINGENVHDFDSLYGLCVKTLNERRLIGKKLIATLIIKDIGNEELQREIENGELLALLQEEEQEEQSFVYVATLTYEESNFMTREQLTKKADFYQELFETIDDYHHYDEAVAFLYEHHQARKFLERLTEQEKQTLVQEAEQTLIKLLATEQ